MKTNEDQFRIEAIGDQLRTKISNKFQTSTFLAGLSFAVIGLQLSMLWQAEKIPKLLPFSIPLMVSAVLLYVVAAIKLDGLTMPKRFWEEGQKEGDQTFSRHGYLQDEDLWELRKRMLFYWTYCTTTAIYLTIISIILMLIPLDPISFSLSLIRDTFLIFCIVTSITIIYFLILYLRSKKVFQPLLRPFD